MKHTTNLAAGILAELRTRGIRAEPNLRGGIRLAPARLVDSELLTRIHEQKTALIALVRAQQAQIEIDRLARADGWQPLPEPSPEHPEPHPAYSILETCRRRGIWLSLDPDGSLRIGKAEGRGQEPRIAPSLLMAIEAHLEAVATLVAAGWHLRSDFPKESAA